MTILLHFLWSIFIVTCQEHPDITDQETCGDLPQISDTTNPIRPDPKPRVLTPEEKEQIERGMGDRRPRELFYSFSSDQEYRILRDVADAINWSRCCFLWNVTISVLLFASGDSNPLWNYSSCTRRAIML